ncbi:PP2C family protein-serine/threonine phosphatase [Calditrichota bacterium]
MSESFSQKEDDPKFWKTIKEDWQKTQVKRTLKQDFKEIRDFYISAEQKKKMEKMGKVKRWFFILLWLLKGMFFKLTPMRRILLLVSFILILSSGGATVNSKGDVESGRNPVLGFLVITFVLMLELKDKILARDELREGRAIQIALSPDESPDIPGWDVWLFSRPANDVGGDFVDFMQIDNKRYNLALGDVAGKGMGAALLMAKLQATIRAVAPDKKSLSEIGEKINSIFHRDSLRNKFASLVYLECDSKGATVRFLNAGHFPPLLISGNDITETSKGSAALGIMEGTKYDEQKLTVNKGDLFFVYSDGLIEACNERDEFYGEERLRKLLLEHKKKSSREVGKLIINSVDLFRGDTFSYDDLSMIILKRN